MEPIGKGNERRAFINPKNERKIISEMKDEAEKDTPYQLKGRYYLTKIAHLLLPKNIPDIDQAGESIDGKQTVDTERISHTPGHTRLQEMRQSGEYEESAREQIIEEIGAEMGELDLELERIGLGFNIDPNVGNYTKDKTGNVYYLETFKPWQVDPINPEELEMLFGEEELREAIDSIPDQKAKKKCTRYLERLLFLLEEEKQELRKYHKANLIERDLHIGELKAKFVAFEQMHSIETLRDITTEEEAQNSTERESAKRALIPIESQLKVLRDKINITAEEYNKLHEKYKILSHAVGIINRGVLEHGR